MTSKVTVEACAEKDVVVHQVNWDNEEVVVSIIRAGTSQFYYIWGNNSVEVFEAGAEHPDDDDDLPGLI
jgi:hypothetical protein